MFRKLITIIFSLILWALQPSVVLANTSNSFNFRTISSPRYELLSNTITSIVQDDVVGFIWIGSRKGLFCYNGTDYKEVAAVNHALSSALRLDITKLCFDKRGWLWIGTNKGILVYEPSTNRMIEIDNSDRLNNVIVRDMFPTQSGDVLIGSRNHLFAYKSDVAAIKEITPAIRNDKADKTPYFFYSFCEGADATIWLSSAFGLLNFKNGGSDYSKYAFYPYKETFGTDVISKQQILLQRDAAGNLLLGSDRGLYILNVPKKTIQPYNYTVNNQFSNIRALSFDCKNRLWIGTLNGMLVTENYQKPTILTYDAYQQNSLSDNRIFALFSDKNKTMWIGTNYGGVNIWSHKRTAFVHINDKGANALPNKTVNFISGDEKGNVFFGTEKKGVSEYNQRSKSIDNIVGLDTRISIGINSMLVDNNTFWLATISDGLITFNRSTKALKRYLIDESGVQTDLSFINNVLSVAKLSDAKLLVGTFHKGLNIFYTKTGEFTNIPLKAFTSPQRIVPAIQKIIIDKQANIWVLAQDDVYRLRVNKSLENGFEVTQIYNGNVEDGWVSDVCVSKDDELWFSCPKGSVYRFSEGKLTKIEIGKNVDVLSIVAGDDNSLWMSSSVGIVYLNNKTLETKIFDESFGLVKNEFTERAGIVARDGEVFFGGASGLTKFYPANILGSKTDSLKTLITGLFVFNNELLPGDSTGVLSQPIAYTKHLTLSHKQNMFTLTFAAEDFSLSKPNRFEYRLLGFSDNWIETSSPKVTYTLQSGGDYTFEVRLVNANGIPSSKVMRLQITLLNPWWKTPIAYAFYVFVILFISGWLFNLYRAKTKLKHQLQIDAIEHEKQKELNEQKLRFFTNISHDFRTPLTLIIGTIEQFAKKFPLSNEMHQMLLGAQKNSSQLMNLINDLMDFRKIDNQQTRISVSEREIVAFVHEVFLSFSNEAESKKINYSFTTNVDELLVYFDAPKLERIILNLLTNAFKFTNAGAEITVQIISHADAVDLVVKDSGCGIAQEHLAHIFDRFYEGNGRDAGFLKGNGIGLTIVKNFVELHKGIIKVDSVIGQGSAFTVTFALGNKHFAPSEIVELQSDLELLKLSQQAFNTDDKRRIQSIVDDILHKKDKKYTVLLVEDDEELGLFLKETLRDYFNVNFESNGLKAYQSVLNNPPDLIISDVVMPVMNGIELCRKIKANTDISYIPFILLTARAALANKLEGLESGADDYLNKPFQVNELLLKCANILKTQEQFRQRFLSVDAREPKELAVAKDDDYTKVLKILNANITNDTFGVTDLCQEMGMSRSVLYSKVKEWTNQSPGELLLGFRMKRAATLLEQQKYTVAEVANKVGYKQATYFTKSFKAYYKMLPSDYVKKYCK